MSAVVGVVVVLLTFIKAVWEYTQQGVQKRAQAYLDLQNKFLEDVEHRQICVLLETDDVGLSSVSSEQKLKFLGFYEQVALMLNSNLLREEVAHYMFGFYAIKCLDSTHFWSDNDKNNQYWALFCSFAKRMKIFERNKRFDSTKIRF